MTNHVEIKYARKCAKHIRALGGPDLCELSDDELLQHMGKAMAAIANAAGNIEISARHAGKTMQRFCLAIRHDAEQLTPKHKPAHRGESATE